MANLDNLRTIMAIEAREIPIDAVRADINGIYNNFLVFIQQTKIDRERNNSRHKCYFVHSQWN
jgi:hypothetical protein